MHGTAKLQNTRHFGILFNADYVTFDKTLCIDSLLKMVKNVEGRV